MNDTLEILGDGPVSRLKRWMRAAQGVDEDTLAELEACPWMINDFIFDNVYFVGGGVGHDKKLHRWLDPIAGQLLEAGTYHWKRVHDHLNLPFWQSDDLPNHWSALREKSIEAADNAMAELVVLCSGCVGEPTKSRDDDLKDVIEDFVDLDIQDALQGLGRIVSSDDQAYSFHSPEAQVIFEPGRAIAERLKELADQVEQASTRARSESVDIPAGAYSTESIDILLIEFRAVKQAEDELHQTQGQ